MNPVHQAALDLQQFVQGAGWKFCFIGGIVVPRWGVDMTVLTRFVQDDECIAGLLGRFAARHANAAEFAARARVLLLRHENGVELDVALGALDFEARCIDRASWWTLQRRVKLFTCSAEDLVVHKAFASRDRDWADVDSIISVQRERLDLVQIRAELAPLAELKEDATILPHLERIMREHGVI